MSFQIFIPTNLTFHDYISIVQCSRTLADGFDKKDRAMLRASLAPFVVAEYSRVRPEWTKQKYSADEFIDEWLGPNHLGSSEALLTFHLLGVPYFKTVTDERIVVNYQQLASHARRAEGEDWTHPQCKIEGDSDGKSWMEQTFTKVDGLWKISAIEPAIHYRPGNLASVNRRDDVGR